MNALKIIEIAERLYEARETVKKIMGDNYKPAVGMAIELVRIDANEKNVSEMSAAIDLAKQHNVSGSRLKSILFLAAALELTERKAKGTP